MAPFRRNTLSLLRFHQRRSLSGGPFLLRKCGGRIQKERMQAKQLACSVGLVTFVEFIYLCRKDRLRKGSNLLWQSRKYVKKVNKGTKWFDGIRRLVVILYTFYVKFNIKAVYRCIALIYLGRKHYSLHMEFKYYKSFVS